MAGLQRQLAGLQAALADAQGVLGPAGGALGAMTAQFFGLLQVAALLEGVLSLAENVGWGTPEAREAGLHRESLPPCG